MNNKPLVSTIIIFLNGERFIEEAIESVFSQTYDNWELLLVDDGSTDKSTEIARRYAGQFPHKVCYLEHDGRQNRGMSASRNLGIRKAKGKYISFLDADDVWLPHKLEQQVSILESQPEAAMVYGPLHVWYSWTGNPEDIKRDSMYGVPSNGVQPYSNSLVKPPNVLSLFLSNEFFLPGGFLLRREVIECVGEFEESFRDAYSDAIFLVKVCLTSTVFVSGECWYKYRKHPESNTATSTRDGKDNYEERLYLNWVKEYLSQKGVKDAEVWKSLRKSLWRCRLGRLYSPLWSRLRHRLIQMKKSTMRIARRTFQSSFHQ